MNKVTFICPIYNTFPEIIGSLINQTHQNWELLLIHDGPNSTNLDKLIECINDKRIKYTETSTRIGEWGHPYRKWALDNIDILSPNTDYIVITNGDNNHFPHYCEYLLKGFNKSNIVATYCSQFVHAYESWQRTTIIENVARNVENLEWEIYKYGIIDTRLELGYIDCGGVMVKKEVAVESGWNDFAPYSDWSYFERIITKYGKDSWNIVRGCLFSHN
jgi:hypothetical protein